ncbi:putative C6 transcription factor [Xylaria curta]|nr:putative C6 transcription factor [Xylaria curta]
MAGRQFIPIQPKRSLLIDNDSDLHAQLERSYRSRNTILIACDSCRRLKTKCDGRRPACRKCHNKRRECTYELPQEALSRSSARKEITKQLQRENAELRQLFHDLSTRQESEALNIFQRLRETGDPIALARSIRQAELLLPPTVGDCDNLTIVRNLELDAFGRSPMKIQAQPWTTVAGDGVVSELISSWFKWDNAFLYSFIDRECFMEDIHDGDPDNAVHCSPFLVNAICAFRSYFSETVDMVQRATNLDLKVQFLAETIRQYDYGLPNIPKIQGLWILFAISSLKGEDRKGNLYRFASYGMLRRSKLKQVFWSLTDTDPCDIEKKRVISKNAWGLFCLESITNTSFHNTDVLQPPKIPCLFPDFDYGIPVKVDLFGQEFTALSAQPPSLGGAISMLCQLAVLMSEVMTLRQGKQDNGASSRGYQVKLKRTRAALAQLDKISGSLPSALHHNSNFTPETCFLRVVMNTVAYMILRSVPLDAVLDEGSGMTVRSAILGYCALDAELMERYFAAWSTPEFSTMAFLGPLNAGTVLLPLLSYKHAQQLFPRICRLMSTIAKRMPVAKYAMKGWRAAIWSRKMDIPEAAKPYFQNLGEGQEMSQDVPTSLVVAHIPDFENSSLDDRENGELGFLLKRWSAITKKEGH